jgi:hypothetical protein
MRKNRVYAAILTALVAVLLMSWVMLASEPQKPVEVVRETITVTALADVERPSAPHATMRRFLQAYNPYDVPRSCLDIQATDDDQYVFEVMNRCAATAQLLGRWRVDKVSHAVIRQR